MLSVKFILDFVYFVCFFDESHFKIKVYNITILYV